MHWPDRALQPLEDWNDRKLAHSERLVLPRMTAPALRSFLAMNESLGTFDPSRAREPAVVSILSSVAMLSLRRIGMPWSRDRGPFFLRSWSISSAISRASGLISRTELSWIPRKSSFRMRSMYSRVRRREVSRPLSMAR